MYWIDGQLIEPIETPGYVPPEPSIEQLQREVRVLKARLLRLQLQSLTQPVLQGAG